MANKLPSFLQKPAAVAEALSERPVVFRAPRAAAKAADGSETVALRRLAEPAEPAAKLSAGIFRTVPPQLISSPEAAVRRAPRPSPPPGAPEAPAFRVVPLARLAQGGRWKTEAMRSYPFPALLWFTRGQGRITVAGVTRGFGAHNLVVLPPNTMHGYEATGQVFGTAIFFPEGADLPLPAEPVHLRFREAHDQAELNLLIDNLAKELERDLPSSPRAVALHAGLLSVWLERQVDAQARPEGRDRAAERLSAAYAALVEREFRDGLSVAEFAQKLGVTPTHLTRSCNAACGRPAHEILSDRIFFEARKLLRETEMPVKDIAESLGFHSAAYFTRAFQKAAGKPPTAFRRAG